MKTAEEKKVIKFLAKEYIRQNELLKCQPSQIAKNLSLVFEAVEEIESFVNDNYSSIIFLGEG